MTIFFVCMLLSISMRASSLLLGLSLFLLWIMSSFFRFLPLGLLSFLQFLLQSCRAIAGPLPFVFLQPHWVVQGVPSEGRRLWVVVVPLDSPRFLVEEFSLTLETVRIQWIHLQSAGMLEALMAVVHRWFLMRSRCRASRKSHGCLCYRLLWWRRCRWCPTLLSCRKWK